MLGREHEADLERDALKASERSRRRSRVAALGRCGIYLMWPLPWSYR
jgi:hypothetical protein